MACGGEIRVAETVHIVSHNQQRAGRRNEADLRAEREMRRAIVQAGTNAGHGAHLEPFAEADAGIRAGEHGHARQIEFGDPVEIVARGEEKADLGAADLAFIVFAAWVPVTRKARDETAGQRVAGDVEGGPTGRSDLARDTVPHAVTAVFKLADRGECRIAGAVGKADSRVEYFGFSSAEPFCPGPGESGADQAAIAQLPDRPERRPGAIGELPLAIFRTRGRAPQIAAPCRPNRHGGEILEQRAC